VISPLSLPAATLDVLASTQLIIALARNGPVAQESGQSRGLDRLGLGRGFRCTPVDPDP
jgi:hypothetical protein